MIKIVLTMTDDEFKRELLVAIKAIPAALGAQADALRELVERLCPPPPSSKPASSKPSSSKKRGGV